jgi:RND family efflux transporter MFP subunit
METARSSLNRIRGLYENNNVPLGEYESAKEKYSNALASFNAEQRATDLLKRELNYYHLYSPADGIVLSSDVSTNENIQSGQIVAVIQSGEALAVKVGIPEQLISRIKSGQTAKIQFPSIPNTSFAGKVSEVAYTVSQDSSVYPVTVLIKDPSSKIRPGMPANVSFIFKSNNPKSKLFIPLHSVAKDDSGSYVLLVVESEAGYGVVHKTPVKVGRMTSDGFEVLDGLSEGDNVITAGVFSLEDGMRVRFIK